MSFSMFIQNGGIEWSEIVIKISSRYASNYMRLFPSAPDFSRILLGSCFPGNVSKWRWREFY